MPIFDQPNLDRHAAEVAQVPDSPAYKPQTSIGAWPYGLIGGAAAGDIASTAYAMSKGAQEGNPVMGSGMGTIVPLKAGLALGSMLAARHLASHGHPTAAKVLAIASSAPGIGATLHNVMLARQLDNKR